MSWTVSCSADRNIKAKITPEGIFLEQLEKNPARFLPKEAPGMSPAVDIDLDEGMDKVREILSKYPIKTRLNLKGTLIVARDIAHARIKQMIDEGKKAASITNAYAENAQVVVMKQSEVGKYKTTDDLKNLKSIAIEGGSAGEKAAQAAGLTNTVVSDSQALALTEVTSGSADACIIDLTMANAMTGEGTGNKNLTYSIKLEAEEYGIALRKGSDMAAKTNELMAGLMKDGTLDKLAKKYQIVLIKDADNK